MARDRRKRGDADAASQQKQRPRQLLGGGHEAAADAHARCVSGRRCVRPCCGWVPAALHLRANVRQQAFARRTRICMQQLEARTAHERREGAPPGRWFCFVRAAQAWRLWSSLPARRAPAATGPATAPARSGSACRPARAAQAKSATRGSARAGRGGAAACGHAPPGGAGSARAACRRAPPPRAPQPSPGTVERARVRWLQEAPRTALASRATRTSERGSSAVSSRCSCGAPRGSAQGAAAEVNERRAARAAATDTR